MPSYATRLKVQNNTKYCLKTEISDVDDEEFDGVSRPNNNFHNRRIQPWEYLEEREELNQFTTANMFTMHIHVNGEKIMCRVDQGLASHNTRAIDCVPTETVETVSLVAAPFTGGLSLFAYVGSKIVRIACKIGEWTYEQFQNDEKGRAQVIASDHFCATIDVIKGKMNTLCITVTERS